MISLAPNMIVLFKENMKCPRYTATVAYFFLFNFYNSFTNNKKVKSTHTYLKISNKAHSLF